MGRRVDFEGQAEHIQHILNKETFNERLPTEVWSGLRHLREKLEHPGIATSGTTTPRMEGTIKLK